ncbi:glutamate-1-semialdehyde 2 1-aminomutase [Clostridium sp. CAG:590]|nr:glutamate-1-semialdehyde 2 1-aminomutase [Clostridium sp. CAG:590]
MTRSENMFEEAKKIMPGGVNSPVRAYQAVHRSPLFIDHAKGSKIVDVDGKEYIDYVCSWGPGILGHADDRVIKAVQDACEKGLTFGAPTEKETILAELVQEIMPSMEMMRLVNSGTEAVMSAIRVARGYTGRDKIVKFRGCYHGHSDGLLVKAGSGALTQAVPDSLGVPADYTKNTLVAEYNDIDSVKQLFEQYGKEIATVVVEPVAANMGVVPPKQGFLKDLREITQQYGALLIFDEVITGFRLSLGGAQEYYGITPDLTTLGKIIGGGMPMAAYGGRREIMEKVAPLGGVYQAGTLSGNPIATTACITTLRILKENADHIYPRIAEATRQLADAARDTFGDRVQVNQVGSLMSVFFTKEPVVDYKSATASDTEAYAAYFNAMLQQGIYLAPSQFEAMFVSAVHSKEDLARTIEAMSNC